MPGQYNDKLKAEYHPPHNWKLVSPLSFVSDEVTQDDLYLLKRIGMENDVDENGKITVPIGFETTYEAAMFDLHAVNCLDIDNNQWITIEVNSIRTIIVP